MRRLSGDQLAFVSTDEESHRGLSNTIREPSSALVSSTLGRARRSCILPPWTLPQSAASSR